MSSRRNPFVRPARKVLVLLTVAGLVFAGAGPAASDYQPGIPPEVDPGDAPFTGAEDPVPDEPVPFDPTSSMLQAIYDADAASGGDSFWLDRVLERPSGGNGQNALYTRGRALYMYTHAPGTLGFAGAGTGANQGGGGFAYREAIAPGVTHLYTVTIPGVTLQEVTTERRQYPSHWSSVHESTAAGLRVAQQKFITHNNVAVTNLTITNTGSAPTTRALVATSPIATTVTSSTELTGTVNTRYNITMLTPRFSGEGFAVNGSTLTRDVTLESGESVTLKLQLGATTQEIPESTTDYERYRDYDPQTAFRTQLAEYNQWWVDNVPYIDVPDENIMKMSYYRTFLNRYNYIDANVPGNDYQFPVSIEGVLGYDNAISLTQPMHIQDLKYFRDPLYSYGNWVSAGETSKCSAFFDNPGSFSWGNTLEQYTSREAWNAYKMHGGDPTILENLAHYAECDAEGQLGKFDQNDNFLVEYNSGLFTGNDADTDTLHWPQFLGLPVAQDRAESAYQYSGAKAAAEAYALLGNEAKAAEMEALADNISDAILTLLWDDSPIVEPPTLQPVPPTRSAGQAGFGNAIQLGPPEPNQYLDMPDGIISGLTDFTVAAWVNRTTTSGQTWSRVFDFGTGTGVNMFLTPDAGGAAGARFAITVTGSGGEQQITAADPLPTGWHHVAVTKNGTTGALWVDGELLATNANLTLSPASLGTTTNNWIGRSQYADPLLQATVDEFQIYGRALSQPEIVSLMTSPAGTPGGGDVAWYRVDEQDGDTAFDASGNDRHATVVTRPEFVGDWPGKVFKHRLVANGEPVQWKDQQNFVPFIEGVVPNTDDYKQALRYYADADEFPIMPSYTANQRDKAMAQAVGVGGTNNFSNINWTLQAQLYSRALREYPTEFITPDMYRKLLEWLTWTQYVGGDNRLPNNNEFFFNWNPESQTLGRSGIFHNILGAYNFMIIDDIAGVRPRLDEVVELWPIDVGWDHFAVNNLSYHGRDLTLVWDRPGDGADHYANAPDGYSVYLEGARIFTVDDLAHVSWDSETGTVSVLDGSDTTVVFQTKGGLQPATEIGLSDNARATDMFQKAGLDLSLETGWNDNLAEGKPVTASFTTTTPAVRATAAEFAVDGFTISGLPFQQPTYVAPNTIWGTQGSPNAQDWLEVDLGEPTVVNTAKLYFYSDKAYVSRDTGTGNTYRQPASYTVQYHDGTGWVDVPSQVQAPASPLPNLNTVDFAPVTAQRLRVLVTPTSGFGVGLKEIQLFNEVRCDATLTGAHAGALNVTAGVTCLAEGATVTGPVTVGPGAGLVASKASVVGPLFASGASIVELFDSLFDGSVSISGSTTRVAVAHSRVDGPLRLTGNSTGSTAIVVTDNTVDGPLTCSGNQLAPINYGEPNTVTGPTSGQCAGL
jgi:hypothetical protein